MQNKLNPATIHWVLGHSYLVYFGAIIVGLGLDAVFPDHLVPMSIAWFGAFIMICATGLIYVSQKTSRDTAHERHKHSDSLASAHFKVGPYKYMRSPTHMGLLFVTIGFGLMASSVYVVAAGLIAFLLTRFIFVRKEEELLEVKYGQAYVQYKKEVHF